MSGKKNAAPCWLCNSIGPAAVPAASSSSASPLAAQVLGVSCWGFASCRPGISAYTDCCQAEPEKGIFRAVDLTPAEFALL